MTLQHNSESAKVASCSFTYFVYPFLFRPKEFSERVQALEQAMTGGFKVWEPYKVAPEDLMPHVAQYLNVEAEQGIAGTGQKPCASRMWQLNDDLENVLGLAGRANWTLSAHDGRNEVPFRLGEVGDGKVAAHLALFSVGVGLLTVQATPKSDALDDWLDFLHYFRIGDGKRDIRLRAVKRTGKDQITPFFPALAGGLEAHPEGKGVLRDLLQALLHTGDTEIGTVWWEEVFVGGRVLPFFGLYVDGLKSEREQAELRYRLRHFFCSGQAIIPNACDLREDHPSLLPYAENQWSLFTIEGGGFLACDAPKGFFRDEMPGHLRHDYFLVFLLALHQRFALIGMSNQVALHWPLGESSDDAGRERTFEGIRNTLLTFTARGYFAQVMQRDNHHACYRQWQEVFQIARLYEEVRDEVREMHEYLRMRQAERTQRIQEETQRIQEGMQRKQDNDQRIQEAQTGVITWFVAALTLTCAVFGFLGINVNGLNVPSLSLGHALLILGVVIGIAALFLIPPLRRHQDVLRELRQSPRNPNKDESQ